MNKGKKLLAVLSTAAMIASIAPAAGLAGVNAAYAAGAGSVSANTVPTLSNNGTSVALGTANIDVPKFALQPGSTVTISLPQGVTLPKDSNGNYLFGGVDVTDTSNNTNNVVSSDAYDSSNSQYTIATPFGANSNYFEVSDAGGANNGSGIQGFTAKILSDNEIQLTYNGTSSNNADDSIILLHLGSVAFNGVSNGPLSLTLAAPTNSSFPTGTVTVANIASSGTVDVAATSTQTGSNVFTFNLNLTEEVANSFANSSNSIKLKLPNGYVWDNPSTAITNIFGDQIKVDNTATPAPDTIQYSGAGTDTLSIGYTAPKDSNGNVIGTSAATSIQLPLQFEVNDDSVVKDGDIVVGVSGVSSINVSQITVGTYGTYGGAVSTASTPTIIAGHKEQQVGDIAIKETAPGSFVSGRTVELTLPEGARWEDEFENSSATTPSANVSYQNGLNATYSYSGTDKRTLKITFTGTGSQGNTSAGEIDLKNVQVAVAPDFNGPLNVTVGGSAGVTGNVQIATSSAPLAISAASKPTVTIGASGQKLGDITLTENVAGALNTDAGASNSGYVKLALPSGVTFTNTPTVTVSSGDLTIDQGTITTGTDNNNKGYLEFKVTGESTTPSTVTISGAQLSVDRTVAEGDIALKVQGPAASWTANAPSGYDNADWNANDGTAAKTVVATVGTSAPGINSTNAVFTIGSSSYTVNGQTQTAVVAPFIKDSRTFVGVRDVATALGVDASNIIWNGSDSSVTIFKGNRVVRMVIGSNVLTVNGTPVTMDTAPEILNSRTVLPIAWVAQALGVSAQWDATSQTVSFQ